MTVQLIDMFETAWIGAGGASMVVGRPGPHEDAATAGRATFPAAAPGTELEFAPPAPLDLSELTELRFWLRVPRTQENGMVLHFGYEDASDVAVPARLWQVPVARAGTWEQVRIGIGPEVRGAVTRFFFLPADDRAITADLGELLAAHSELALDVETAIANRIDLQGPLPGLTALPVLANVPAGATTVDVAATEDLIAGSLIEADDGLGSVSRFTLASAATAGGMTTLGLAAGDAFPDALTTGTAAIRGLTAVVTDTHPPAGPLPAAVRLTLLDMREDRRRMHTMTLTDSYRIGAGGIVSTADRPFPRGWTLDYQLTVEAPTRQLRLRLLDRLGQIFNFDRPLRVAGALTQLEVFHRPDLPRQRSVPHPESINLRVSADQEFVRRHGATVASSARVTFVPEGAPDETVNVP